MTNRRWKFGYVFGFVLFGILPACLPAQPYDFATLNFKVARGINDGSAGPIQIVGDSQELVNGIYTDIAPPGADPLFNAVFRNNNGGDVVGHEVLNGVMHGFDRIFGLFNFVDFPGFVGEPLGINDSFMMVGEYVDGASQFHAYLRDSMGFHTIDPPGATFAMAFKINNAGLIVGTYTDSSSQTHGFLRVGTSFVTLDYPGAIATEARGVSNIGQIVGDWEDSSHISHGFLLTGGNYFSFDYPGAAKTFGADINAMGDIVGWFVPAGGGGTVGFIAVPSPSGALAPSGGTIGTQAKIMAPAGVFTAERTLVTLDVLTGGLPIPNPNGYAGPGTRFVIIDLMPEPAMPLPAPGVTLVLPLMHPMMAGDRLDLFRVDPATGQYVPELNANGSPVMGTVDVDGVTATFHNVMHLSTVVGLTPATIGVTIDIKPGEDPATIQTNSQGKIPVAILSSPTFNVPAMVNPATLTFGRTGDEHSLAFCSGIADVNGDGLPDLVCHFDTQAAGFQAGDEVGVLKGKTVANVRIEGVDRVVVR